MKVLTIIAAVITTLVAASASADSASITVVGQKQGVIKGGNTERGKEGSIAVLGIEHSITSPRDPQSGLPTGKRMHTPLVVYVSLDQASPQLYQALVSNENLTDVSLKIWQGVTGSEINAMTIKLANASISAIKLIKGEPQAGTTLTTPTRLEVSFTYQRITWTWVNGGTTATDDWEAGH